MALNRSNVSPSFMGHNCVDTLPSHTETSRKIRSRLSRREERPDSPDNVVGQLAFRGGFSPKYPFRMQAHPVAITPGPLVDRDGHKPSSAALHSVKEVVVGSSTDEMLRIAAGAVVTRMADHQSGRLIPSSQEIGDTVCSVGPVLKVKGTISVGVAVAGKGPAFVRLSTVDLCPKDIGCRSDSIWNLRRREAVTDHTWLTPKAHCGVTACTKDRSIRDSEVICEFVDKILVGLPYFCDLSGGEKGFPFLASCVRAVGSCHVSILYNNVIGAVKC